MLQLEGQYEEAETDVQRLERQIQELQQQLTDLQQQTIGAVARVQGQVDKIHRAFASVLNGGVTTEASATSPSRTSSVWESWKQRLAGTAAKIIDALLVHGELNTQQLAIATGLHRTTIPKGIYDLNKAGLINKNAGRFSLKQL